MFNMDLAGLFQMDSVRMFDMHDARMFHMDDASFEAISVRGAQMSKCRFNELALD
jgi:hypothetical protein